MSSDYDQIRNKLKVKHAQIRNDFSSNHPHIEKYLAEKGISLSKIREHSAKIIGAGALAGALLLSPPIDMKALPSPEEIIQKLNRSQESSPDLPQKILIDALKSSLPTKTQPLNNSQEKYLESFLTNITGVKVKATLEGEHLNTVYGLIGAEQHLRRYPGDTLGQHGAGDTLEEGIAPGLGAWGYFASSYENLTPGLINTEKWYAVVQTLYLPNWNERAKYLINWYKYRKVLIVDTDNGNAVVAAIADSGPAAWTGKSFGGSPEVMEYLGGPKYKKGPVLVFFVDDPDNKVPLGPVDYNKINMSEMSLVQS
jgi:hypothetical protein